MIADCAVDFRKPCSGILDQLLEATILCFFAVIGNITVDKDTDATRGQLLDIFQCHCKMLVVNMRLRTVDVNVAHHLHLVQRLAKIIVVASFGEHYGCSCFGSLVSTYCIYQNAVCFGRNQRVSDHFVSGSLSFARNGSEGGVILECTVFARPVSAISIGKRSFAGSNGQFAVRCAGERFSQIILDRSWSRGSGARRWIVLHSDIHLSDYVPLIVCTKINGVLTCGDVGISSSATVGAFCSADVFLTAGFVSIFCNVVPANRLIGFKSIGTQIQTNPVESFAGSGSKNRLTNHILGFIGSKRLFGGSDGDIRIVFCGNGDIYLRNDFITVIFQKIDCIFSDREIGKVISFYVFGIENALCLPGYVAVLGNVIPTDRGNTTVTGIADSLSFFINTNPVLPFTDCGDENIFSFDIGGLIGFQSGVRKYR